LSHFLDDDNEVTSEVRVPLQKSSGIVGAPRTIDVKDSYANRLLNQHLARLITGDKREILIDEIEEITQQLVAGYLFRIKGEYEVEGARKVCTISILNQPWTKDEEQVIISAKCEDGSCYVTDSYTCSPDSLYDMPHVSRSDRLFLFA
jgi:hypothetical protein